MPSRIRWSRSGVRLALIIIVGVSAMRWFWGYESGRRLQKKVSEIRGRGEPLLVSDFITKMPRANLNAALKYMEAMDSLVLTTQQQNYLLGAIALWPDQERQLVAGIAVASESELGLIREATALPDVEWGLPVSRFAPRLVGDTNTRSRRLATVLKAVATHHYNEGNHDETIALWLDMLALSRAISHNYFLTSHMDAIETDNLTFDHIENLIPTLKPSRIGKRRTIELVETLIDVEPARRGLIRALQQSRAYQLELIRMVGSREFPEMLPWPSGVPSISDRLATFSVAPLCVLDGCRLLDCTSALIDAAGQHDWSILLQVLRTIERDSWSAWTTPRLGRWEFQGLLGNMARIIDEHVKSLAVRRMTATALALRLFELDHGQQPEALDELVPEYLPAIPKDPFSPEGQSILYRQSPYVMLYSVGLNGLDDHGHYAHTDANGGYVPELDYVFFLDGKRDEARQAARVSE